jgi:2-polyprenyl-3-methyl-5-hydroxy-6-metoxy-1,4-benzoquinol methylase
METEMYSACDDAAIHPCPVCGYKHFDVLFSAMDFDSGKEPFQLTRCKTCHMVRTEPVFFDSQLEQYYSLPYYGDGKKKFIGLAELLTHFFNRKRARSILSHMNSIREWREGRVNKILDIGCGRGNLLKILNEMGCECYGVERAEFPRDGSDSNIRFYTGKLNDISLTKSFFDAVVIWHVLEHTDNPMQMIQETARILRPGGILAVAVPNFGSFQARLFRERWFHLDLPRHRHHFTPDTLLRLLVKNDFNIIRQHTFSLEQNPFGFIQSFFNTIMPSQPNRFYSLLKKTKGPSSAIGALAWAIFAVFVFPFALSEYFLSGIFGRGATFIVYAQRK